MKTVLKVLLLCALCLGIVVGTVKGVQWLFFPEYF